jgi:hypothetical protein
MQASRLIAFAFATCLMGQDAPPLIGSGYVLPTPISVAPGQLMTLVMQGVDTGNTAVTRAPSGQDLRATLAGVSVNFNQGINRLAPILEVHQFCVSSLSSPWNWRAFCIPLSAVTVQIPFEAKSLLPNPEPGNGVPAAQLSAGRIPTFDVAPLTDQVHIITACDAFMRPLTYAPIITTGLPCASIVTHADGSAVSAVNPARAGEALVIYAVGLGQTDPPSVTGKLVTEAAPAQTKFTLDFNFHPNALPSRPLPTGPRPLYAGTTPGYVGLYQVNFVVPSVPDGTPACVETSTLPAGSNVVESNLTVSVGGTYSFDGARICVAAPNP